MYLDKYRYKLFSKYPFTFQMHFTNGPTAIGYLTELFFLEGTSPEVFIDNGQIFNSKVSSEKCWLRHTTSSPYYPHPNNFIESYVKILKIH